LRENRQRKERDEVKEWEKLVRRQGEIREVGDPDKVTSSRRRPTAAEDEGGERGREGKSRN